MAQAPIKTLLITGQNNHNWPVSHVVLKRILENSGRFEVDFAISPAAGEDMSGFVLDFEPYALVVLDYNGDAWPAETNRRFLEDARPGQYPALPVHGFLLPGNRWIRSGGTPYFHG